MTTCSFWILLVSSAFLVGLTFAFSPIASIQVSIRPAQPANGQPFAFRPESSHVVLRASGGGKKRKRRRRKDQSTQESVPDQVTPATPMSSTLEDNSVDSSETEQVSAEEMYQIRDVAKFKFQQDGATSVGSAGNEIQEADTDPIPLPDIKETMKKKEEEERARIEEQEQREKRRIKRSDKEAFTKLLEQQPYADADDSLFEKEEYTTVSALLGEGSKPFLGIPTGPLQVGHFIGALGIFLMAFIQYPGFPLTNLPTPLRDCLQSGLLITYVINLVLAVVAAFKAGERGQPTLLWVAKTFSVGGLAYDQLTQLPKVSTIKNRRN